MKRWAGWQGKRKAQSAAGAAKVVGASGSAFVSLSGEVPSDEEWPPAPGSRFPFLRVIVEDLARDTLVLVPNTGFAVLVCPRLLR